MYIVLLGPPGAGKGTQAAILAKKMGLAHISSGDIFRQAAERGEELGMKAKAYMESGNLVPDEITINLVLEHLRNVGNGAVLDGFPRNLKQAEALDRGLGKEGKSVDWAVYLEVPEAETTRRLSGRWVCKHCQKPYSAEEVEDLAGCSVCGGELYQRADDRPEVAEKRYKVYLSETIPLLEYYSRQGRLLTVDGLGDIDKVSRMIEEKIRNEEPSANYQNR